MNRASAGILGFAILLGLIAGPASRRTSDGIATLESGSGAAPQMRSSVSYNRSKKRGNAR